MNYYNHDTILDLMSENGKLKDLLQRALPEIQERVEGFKMCYPEPEFRIPLHRNERLLTDIERALEDWETDDPS